MRSSELSDSLNDIASLVPVIDSTNIAASLLHLQMRVGMEQDASSNSRSEHFGCVASEVDPNSDARQSSKAKTGDRVSTEWKCVLPHSQANDFGGLGDADVGNSGTAFRKPVSEMLGPGLILGRSICALTSSSGLRYESGKV